MNLAVGFFDGVHLGHRRILTRADAALTFRNHPTTIFAPERAPRLLMTPEDRLAAISSALRTPGGAVRALAFTPALAAQEPAAFADWLRAEYPDLDTLLCGPNWTFGARGAGDADFLRARGFRVETVPFAEQDGEPVSSTRVRAALASGDLLRATALLGRPWRVVGAVAAGKGLGRTLGFPTLNLRPAEGLVSPPFGVYAVDTDLGRGVANWGLAPTMGDRAWREPVLEVHLLEAASGGTPASGAAFAADLLAFLRPERTFPDLDSLRAQIARDVAEARAVGLHSN